jgi:hypothetical protein
MLTEQQAYMAMCIFLKEIFDRTKAEYLGGLLAGMSLLEDGRPADSAIASDWSRAIALTIQGNGSANLEIKN